MQNTIRKLPTVGCDNCCQLHNPLQHTKTCLQLKMDIANSVMTAVSFIVLCNPQPLVGNAMQAGDTLARQAPSQAGLF